MNLFMGVLDVLAAPAAAIAVTAKVTVVLTVGCVAAGALRRSSAAVRQRVWLLAIAGSVLMPVLLTLPHLVVRVPGEWLPAVTRPSTPLATRVPGSNASNIARTTARFDEVMRMASGAPAVLSAGQSIQGNPNTAKRSTGVQAMTLYDTVQNGAITTLADGAGKNVPTFKNTSGFRSAADGGAGIPHAVIVALWGVWVSGACLLLAWYATGHLWLTHMLRRATVVDDVVWNESLHVLRATLGVRRSVRLVSHHGVQAPMTGGWLHPVIMLPADLQAYTEERRRAVLTHELAHVVRHDYAAQNLAALATALFWFHPVMWFAAARLRVEGERTADDRVLLQGMPADRYARHLLALAQGARVMRLADASAVGMARASQLERRVRAMLDAAQRRSTVASRLQKVAGCASLMAMVPLAAVHVEARNPIVVPVVHLTVIRASDSTDNSAQATVLRDETAPAPLSEGLHTRLRLVERAVKTVPNLRGTTLPANPMPVRSVELVNHTPVVNAPASVVAPRNVPVVAHTDTTFEQTLEAKEGELLDLQVLSGADVIVRGWDEPMARLKATLGGPEWRATAVVFQRTPAGVQLLASAPANRIRVRGSAPTRVWYNNPYATDGTGNNPAMVNHSFELWVPRRTSIKLNSRGGSLTLQDLQGEFRGSTRHGDFVLGASSGTAALQTASGDITVTASALSGTINTQCGQVKLSGVTGGLNASTQMNPITQFDSAGKPVRTTPLIIIDGIPSEDYCTFKPRMSQRPGVDESWPYGNVVLDSAPQGGVLSTRSGSVKLGSSSAVITATSRNGDIELYQMSGDAIAIANNGNVLIQVVNKNGTEHYITARATNGNVVVELPDSLDATIDLESSYTPAYVAEHGRGTVIDSDRALTRSTTREWAGGLNGSQQKYVRAAATFGRGRGRIHIRAFNGNVTLRRAAPG